MVNTLEGANLPHYFEDKEPYIFVYTTYFTDLLQQTFSDFLTVENGWNFTQNSLWFLESIQEFVEFVPELLMELQVRAVLPFLDAFGKVGTYGGFAQACIGIFGDMVDIDYDDANYIITISNITSPVQYLFRSEGRTDFNFLTEDGTANLKTEPIIIPPSGLSTIRNVLRKFLPAEVYEITQIEFTT